MFTDSVTREALALLRRLMVEPSLESFRLVGGTALAMMRGHRLSVDPDLFVEGEVLPESLNTFLTSVVGAEGLRGGADGTSLSGFVDGVKVDVIAYPYPWLEPITLCDGIRLCGLQDIAAMKVSAIGQRGSKKDFFDLAELLAVFSVLEIMTFFKKKYTSASDIHYLQSLVYFDDAEREPEPILHPHSLGWNEVKERIRRTVREFEWRG